jgi:hypothetical protein
MPDPFHLQDGGDAPDEELEYDDNWDVDDEEEEAEFVDDEEDDWVDWEDDDAFYEEEEDLHEDEDAEGGYDDAFDDE